MAETVQTAGIERKATAVTTIAPPAGPAQKAVAIAGALWKRVMSMPPGKRNWLIASACLIAAVCAGMGWYAQRPDWRVLFSGLEGKDVQQVSQELAAAGIPYQMSADGTGIEVPAEMVDKARMEVAAKGNAQFRIRGAILDSLRTLDWSPRELRRKGRAVEEAIRSATQILGRAPSEQEVAAAMELHLSDYQRLLGDLKGLEIGSLHMERTEDSGDEELAYIPGAPEDDPLFRCLKGEMKQRLADAVDDLPEKERLVLTLYYFEELTMKEIGLTLGVVESRVSQIHTSAVLHLRSALAALKVVPASKTRNILNVKKVTTRMRRES